MSSTTEKPTSEAAASEPPSKPPPPLPPPSPKNVFVVDFALRLFLFATTFISVIVMVTSKQSKTFFLPLVPFPVSADAKFTQSPALEYFVAALSVTCLCAILTSLASFSAIWKPSVVNPRLFLLLASIDTLLLGVVASAMGASASIGYLALKGNTHSGWMKVCNRFGNFCGHLGGSIGLSLVSTILLILLILLSTYSLYSRCS